MNYDLVYTKLSTIPKLMNHWLQDVASSRVCFDHPSDEIDDHRRYKDTVVHRCEFCDDCSVRQLGRIVYCRSIKSIK